MANRFNPLLELSESVKHKASTVPRPRSRAVLELSPSTSLTPTTAKMSERPSMDDFNELKALILAGQSKVAAGQAEIKSDISAAVETIRSELTPMIEKNSADISRIEDQVSSIINPTLQYLKIRDNEIAQRDRNPACRIFGLRLPEDCSTNSIATKRFLYNVLFSPMLDKAAAAGEINSAPDEFLSVLGVAHILPVNVKPKKTIPGQKPFEPPIPTILCKFSSVGWKKLCFQFKRGIVDSLNTQNKSEIRIFDDLTSTNLTCMKRIKEIKGFTSFFRDGAVRIKVVSEGDGDQPQEKNRRVWNPFGVTIDEMTKSIKLPE